MASETHEFLVGICFSKTLLKKKNISMYSMSIKKLIYPQNCLYFDFPYYKKCLPCYAFSIFFQYKRNDDLQCGPSFL